MLSIFFCPATESVRVRQQTYHVTFRYEYGGNFSNISPEPWMGAYHSSELPMLMGTSGDFRGPSTPLEAEASVAFQDAYVVFASDSTVQALGSTGWMEYTQLGADQVREFGVQVPVQDVSLKRLE
ncbi:hypothetical protein M433DRAFT_148942 [Acidomyces richmondensis BFW]|nr:MAG: hypothetical protein FE78DRAFT_85637 [Acidomyces sp. 'richmondensis']KYG50339.1 hypothetical protein M433DRAFT_148942 [Acidomyces richmondensis BFW]